ncbi:MAG: hypothetical protein ACR2M0_00735 [Chloroflexia bacterium]
MALCTGVLLSNGATASAAASQTRTAAHPTAHTPIAATHTTTSRSTSAKPISHTVAKPASPVKAAAKPATHTVANHATPAKPTQPATKHTAPPHNGVRSAPIKALAQPKTVEKGIAMHYYPGLFETVARNRGVALRRDVDGYTSRQNCGELGSIVTARLFDPYTGRWSNWLRLQVLDCSARRDVAHHRAIGLILEVDYHTAAATGFVYRGWTEAEVGR